MSTMHSTSTYDYTPYLVHQCAFSASRPTGKERDAESGLDYFGARYYGSTMGRWMSPDWSAKAEPVPYAKLGNSQSLNLYPNVWNSPLSRIDPMGHILNCVSNQSQCG
jgi:RHS repeat-associated protein